MGIQSAVGQNCLNRATDVQLIQTLLNRAMDNYPRFKASTEKLVVDGICKTKTISAIHQFQRVVLNFINSDGVVEPNRNTWKKLNNNYITPNEIRSSRASQTHTIANFLPWFSQQISLNTRLLHESRETTATLNKANKPTSANSSATPQVNTYSQADYPQNR
jgi:hypothetical protein